MQLDPVRGVAVLIDQGRAVGGDHLGEHQPRGAGRVVRAVGGGCPQDLGDQVVLLLRRHLRQQLARTWLAEIRVHPDAQRHDRHGREQTGHRQQRTLATSGGRGDGSDRTAPRPRPPRPCCCDRAVRRPGPSLRPTRSTSTRSLRSLDDTPVAARRPRPASDARGRCATPPPSQRCSAHIRRAYCTVEWVVRPLAAGARAAIVPTGPDRGITHDRRYGHTATAHEHPAGVAVLDRVPAAPIGQG